jgi:hypothetical protein
MHIWSDINPQNTVNPHINSSFQLASGGGFVGGCFVGPYILPHKFNATVYHHFLEHTLPDLLDNVPVVEWGKW